MIKYLIILIFFANSLLFALSDRELGVSIDLAGKQRMLTQKIAKETLLILMKSRVKANKKALKNDVELFDKTLKGLISGDKSLQLVPTKEPEIQAQLKKVLKLWEPFKSASLKVIDGKASAEDYNIIILKNNLKLLEEMNRAVYMYASLGDKKQNENLKMANNINLAGKQRMLTQRMAKDLLIASLASPRDKPPYIEDFKKSRELFDRTLKGLLDGDKELKLQKTLLPNIRNQLSIVKRLWDVKQRSFDNALKSKTKLIEVISELDKIKIEMNRAVKLYTQSINRQKQKNKLSSIVKDYISNKNIMRKLVNISGRQRMLTQRLTKLVVQCALKIEQDSSCQKIPKYIKEYERAIITFVRGNKRLSLPPTKDKKALIQIKKIIKMWKPFAKALNRVAKSKAQDREALLYILKEEQKLLKESDKLVKIYESGDKDQDYLQKARLHIVNIAGRQRMLTQKMTKEKLLWLKLKSKKQKEKMLKTIELFEESLEDLIKGDKERSLPKATNPKIVTQLKKVEEIWNKIKPLYLKESLSQEELRLLTEINPILLKEMNRAVELMEKEVEY